MTKIPIYNVQRARAPKVGKAQLWFLCSAHYLMVVNISVMFHKNISNSFQITGQTQLYDRQTDGQTNVHGKKKIYLLTWWVVS